MNTNALRSLSVAAILAASGATAQGNDWQYNLSFYGFLPDTDIGLDTPRGSADGTLSLSDALENLDMFFFGAFEAHNGRWGGAIDVQYFDLSFSNDTPTRLTSGLDTDLTLTVVTAMGFYRAFEDQQTAVDLAAGLRWTDVESEFKFKPGLLPGRTIGADIDWVDPIIGARVRHQFSDRWSGTALADWGGFDSDSETYQILVTADYEINENWLLRGGFRYISFEYEDDGVTLDIDQYGPLIGVTYRF